MTSVRVFHKPDGAIQAREHRVDEAALGSAAYTNDNVPPVYVGLDWFVCDIRDFYDDEGEVPWETAIVTNAGLARGLRGVQQDTGAIATHLAGEKAKADKMGVLQAKLTADTATVGDIRELMRLERGL
jgi:hypothetical protein